jgi:hypothetical protein
VSAAGLLGFLAIALVCAALAHVRNPVRWRVLTIAANVAWIASDVMTRDWFGVAIGAACIAFILGRDFWNKRGRKTAKVIGDKSRAVIAGMREKMRESAPVPQGVPG